MNLAAWLLLISSIAALSLSTHWVRAQEPGPDDELTIRLIADPDAELPDAVTRTIQLPDAVSAAGVTGSEAGLSTANANRAEAGGARDDAQPDTADNPQHGLDTAAEAQALGREFGEEVAEAARENRENAGRGGGVDLPDLDLPDGVPNLPDDVPNPPDLPDPPGPPVTPPGP